MRKPRRKLRILFVDDDEAVRTTWKYAFGDTFDATVVESGEMALRLLKAPPGGLQFDVLVADHRMPGMTGAELCERAKAVAPDTARVIVTGYRDREAQLCSCSALLEKPDAGGRLKKVLNELAKGTRDDDDDVRRREREAEDARREARAEFHETTARMRSWMPPELPLKERA